MDKNKVFLGSLCAVGCACIWGVMGAAIQYLTTYVGITTGWLVSSRLLCAGILLLTFLQLKNGGILRIWKNKRHAFDLVLFALIGVTLMQYSFFIAITYSNAATATVLQYLAPMIIVVYLAIRTKKMPRKNEIIAVALALFGTFLLATHGNIHSLSISREALLWGLLSAGCMAFYTVFPQELIRNYPSLLVMGWSTLIGGIVVNFIHPFWVMQGTWNTVGVWCYIFVVLIGTVIPYLLFFYALKQIGPTRTSIFASVEPLSSTIVSVLWLGIVLTTMDYIGFVFVVAAVLSLSITPKLKKTEEVSPSAEDSNQT